MKKSRFSDEQIAHALRQSEAGTPVAKITRARGLKEDRAASPTQPLQQKKRAPDLSVLFGGWC